MMTEEQPATPRPGDPAFLPWAEAQRAEWAERAASARALLERLPRPLRRIGTGRTLRDALATMDALIAEIDRWLAVDRKLKGRE